MKAFLLGLAIIAGGVAPGAVCALVGYWLWSDPGVLLMVAPYGAAVLVLFAYLIGTQLLESR